MVQYLLAQLCWWSTCWQGPADAVLVSRALLVQCLLAGPPYCKNSKLPCRVHVKYCAALTLKCLTRLSTCTAEDSFNSAASDGRGSYRSAGSGGDYMSARGSLQPGMERFGSPRGSYGSGSYASAREFGSRQASMVSFQLLPRRRTGGTA